MLTATTIINQRYKLLSLIRDRACYQTWEVIDQGTPKIMKILPFYRIASSQTREEAMIYLQKKATILSQINHPGIPRIETDSYFTWQDEKGKLYYCLVMEKIQGINLATWMEERNYEPISIEQGIDWLLQLIEIIDQLHQHDYIHRQIQPTNIIIRSAINSLENNQDKSPEQLAVIDLFSLPELIENYREETQVNKNYTSPEEVDGKLFRQSDFFNLGQILIYLLTGKQPFELQKKGENGRLIWRDEAPSLNKELGDLIDAMIAPLPQCRRQTAQDILEEISQIKSKLKKPLVPVKNVKISRKYHKNKLLSTPLFANESIKLTNKSQKILQKLSLFCLSLIVVIIAFLPEQNYSCPLRQRDSLSCGEEILVPGPALPSKAQGVKAFFDGEINEAITYFSESLREEPNDPETLIYLNNAKLIQEKIPTYTIAVAVPLETDIQTMKSGLEILQGVAQAQNEINENKKKNRGLSVIIVDDHNNKEFAKKQANNLVGLGNILAVVGHFSSDISLEVGPIYAENKLVMISPTSTSTELTNISKFIFRTVPSDAVTAQVLANYLQVQLTQYNQAPKVALFYNSASNYSQSLTQQFTNVLSAGNGQIIENKENQFNLGKTTFNAGEVIKEAMAQKATAIVLFPNSSNRTEALEVVKIATKYGLTILGGDSLYNNDTLSLGSKEVINLIVTSPWNMLNGPNKNFIINAKSLWGKSVSWRTALTYDATRVLITAFNKLSSSRRIDVENILTEPSFRANGATGEIQFTDNGDRRQATMQLVKVVASNCNAYGVDFVPINFAAAKAKFLNCK